MKKLQALNIPVDKKTVPLSGNYGVEIEIEAGLGYTKQGQRDTMLKLISEFLLPLTEKGFIPPEAVKTMIQRTFETFQFGATAEFMEAMDKYQDGGNLTEQQTQHLEEVVKVALAETLKDLQGSEILPDQKARIEEGKMATLEVIRDAGLADGKPQDPLMEKEIEAKEQEMEHKEEEHNLKMQKLRQELGLEEEQVETDIRIKQVESAHDMAIKEEQSEAQVKLKEKEAQNADSER